jgi:SAM-dependent methyltransferase
MLEYDATCPICLQNQRFRCLDDYFSSRDGLSAETCPFGHCVTRERALAYVIRRLYGETELVRLRIHESSPADRGMSMWFAKHCPRYLQSGFYPDRPIGDMIGQIRNENLERQSFADALFDLVVHLDVMEHLFDPFQALREIYRTLAAGGKCVFTVPTQADKFESVQVAWTIRSKRSAIPSFTRTRFPKQACSSPGVSDTICLC